MKGTSSFPFSSRHRISYIYFESYKFAIYFSNTNIPFSRLIFLHRINLFQVKFKFAPSPLLSSIPMIKLSDESSIDDSFASTSFNFLAFEFKRSAATRRCSRDNRGQRCASTRKFSLINTENNRGDRNTLRPVAELRSLYRSQRHPKQRSFVSEKSGDGARSASGPAPRSYVSRSRLGNSAVETVEIRWPRCRVSRNVETAVAKIQRRKFRFGGRGSSRRAEKDGRGGERGESVDENPTRTREESAERKTSGVRPIETVVPASRDRVSNLRGGNLFLRVRRTTRVENRSMINRAKGMNIIVRTTNK